MAVEVCSATSASSSGFRPGARSFCRSENVQLSDDVAASLSLSLSNKFPPPFASTNSVGGIFEARWREKRRRRRAPVVMTMSQEEREREIEEKTLSLSSPRDSSSSSFLYVYWLKTPSIALRCIV